MDKSRASLPVTATPFFGTPAELFEVWRRADEVQAQESAWAWETC